MTNIKLEKLTKEYTDILLENNIQFALMLKLKEQHFHFNMYNKVRQEKIKKIFNNLLKIL